VILPPVSLSQTTRAWSMPATGLSTTRRIEGEAPQEMNGCKVKDCNDLGSIRTNPLRVVRCGSVPVDFRSLEHLRNAYGNRKAGAYWVSAS